ncbi:MAG: adenosylmethionine--8-amino-7-oxononanoate transaminase [Planctomycetota bacterium]|jgi:adenosylmethionine-8-amino-7-oxononanoate aminotransferase
MERLDQKILWHPFTQMLEWEAEPPIVIEKAEGMELVDVRGRRYLDGVSSLWVNLHGHGHPVLDRAIREQLDKVAHSTFLGLSNAPAVRLASALLSRTPKGLERVFYSDNGSTAAEVALKMAFQYWRQIPNPERERTLFACLKEGYHGDTVGSVSVGGIDLFHATYRPLLFDTVPLPAPHCYRCPFELSPDRCRLACADAAEEELDLHAGRLAGLIMEPLVQGAAGILVHPEGFLARMKKACEDRGILFIADEVATGFGRTGTLFAVEQEGVRPDLMTVAKGLTGGTLPLAATLTTGAVFDAFRAPYAEKKTFYHGHSYTGNPLACASALANLEIFRTERTLERLADKIVFLRRELNRFLELDHVGDVRQKGFMVGIELVAERETRNPFPLERRVGAASCRAARERGVLLRPLGDVVVLMPPLAMEEADLTRVLEAAYDGIREATR